MNKLINCFFIVICFCGISFSQNPGEGALFFSSGSAQFDYPIVFVHNSGELKSDFQPFQQVKSWERIGNENNFVVITFNIMTSKPDTFECKIIPLDYWTCLVNKKSSQSYYNGVYYNKKNHKVFLLNYPDRNAIDFFNKDMSNGITVSPISYNDSSGQNLYPHFTFGNQTLCYNRISPSPFSNVFEIIDSINQPVGAETQWVCAHKIFVPDSLDSLNNGDNLVKYFPVLHERGFFVHVANGTDTSGYEFISISGKRYLVPYLLGSQDSAFQYRNAVIESYNWDRSKAKTVSRKYLEKYPINGKLITINPWSKKKYILRKKGSTKNWEPVMPIPSLKEISNKEAEEKYGPNWKELIIIIPDSFFSNYEIVNPTLINPTFKFNGSKIKFSFFSGNIHLNLDRSGMVSLKIYDLRGKIVATPINGNKNAGKYSISIRDMNLSKGNYLCALQTQNFKQVKKISII